MGACKECGCKDGDRGPMGPAGEKGDTGASGLQGNPGPQGPQGPQGNQGIQGAQGATGPQGPPGSSIGGAAGPTGPQGIQGPQGIPGNDGSDGADGTNGANGQGRLNYVINYNVGAATILATMNEGIFLKNTGGILTIELPTGGSIGDVVRVVGTSAGTGGWRVKATGVDTIEMTNQNPSFNTTTPGGYVTPQNTNYRDVLTFIFDGGTRWVVMDALLANGNQPLFT